MKSGLREGMKQIYKDLIIGKIVFNFDSNAYYITT